MQPMQDSMLPMQDNMLPMQGSMLPMQGSMQPMQDNMPPMQSSMLSMQDYMLSMQGSMQPMQDFMLPMQGSMQPMQDFMLPMQGSMQPMQGSMQPMLGPNMQMDSGMVPEMANFGQATFIADSADATWPLMPVESSQGPIVTALLSQQPGIPQESFAMRPVGPLAAGIQRMNSLGSSMTHQQGNAMMASMKTIMAAAAPTQMEPPNGAPAMSQERETDGNPIRTEEPQPPGAFLTAPDAMHASSSYFPAPPSGVAAVPALPGWVAPFASVGRSDRYAAGTSSAALPVPPPPGTVTVNLGALMARGHVGIRSPLKAAPKGPSAGPAGYVTTGGKRQVPEPGPNVSDVKAGSKVKCIILVSRPSFSLFSTTMNLYVRPVLAFLSDPLYACCTKTSSLGHGCTHCIRHS